MIAVHEKTEHYKGLTPAQYELVNMMSCVRNVEDVAALKSLLVKFMDSRIQAGLDRLYEDGTLSDDRLASLAREHLRTPYKASM